MTPDLQAEQALLGALLLDGHQVGKVAGVLQARHFLRPAHHALYQLLLDQHTAGHPGSLDHASDDDRRDWAMQAMTAAQQASRGFTPGYGQALIFACPSASHASAYARMVLESAARREMHEHATRLLQAANTGELQSTVRLIAALRQVISEHVATWGSDDTSLSVPSDAGHSDAGAQKRMAEAAATDETMLLGSLTARPGPINSIAQWLLPADFQVPGHGRLFDALTALRGRGDPVDHLTLLWEFQQHGGLAELTTDQVREISRCDVAADPHYWAERVLQNALIASTARAAQRVRNLTTDTATTTTALLGSCAQALEPLSEQQRRLADSARTTVPRGGPVLSAPPRTKPPSPIATTTVTPPLPARSPRGR